MLLIGNYRDLVLQRFLGHGASFLCLCYADVADFLHVFVLHRRLGFHLLQLVLEVCDHLTPLTEL